MMIGCTALLVLLGIAAIVFVVKAGAIFGWTMNQLRDQVLTALPADVTPEERERLERGFEAAVARVRAGQVEVPALKAMQLQLQSASTKAPRGDLTRDDVLDLLSTLERVGGLLPAPEAGEAEDGEPEAAPPAAESP
ncbi:MAG: hypothetical protein F9K16_04390 [Thermoanaerobaculia bacterium]|nr:MAG: hypothetical protein F9K16_04390 [Thermoanaerobaculia bacterium]